MSDDQAPAGPAPADKIGDCDYYIWRVQDFKDRNKKTCYKPPTYYMNYGHKYCVEFRDITRPVLSRAGKEWLDRTLFLLQVYMEDEIAMHNKIEYNDDEFTEMAFDTHPRAYWNAKFHNMSILDKIYVAATPSLSEWKKWRTWKQAIKMGLNETEEYALNPYDIQKDAEQAKRDLKDILEGEGPIDKWDRENGY